MDKLWPIGTNLASKRVPSWKIHSGRVPSGKVPSWSVPSWRVFPPGGYPLGFALGQGQGHVAGNKDAPNFHTKMTTDRVVELPSLTIYCCGLTPTNG